MLYKLVLLGALACPLLTCATDSVGQPGRDTRWREDIQVLVQKMSARGTVKDSTRGIVSQGQKDFRKLYPSDRFDAEISALESNLKTLSDDQIVLGLARILAAAHVAHNTVEFSHAVGFEKQLPVGFVWLSDGLMVTRVTTAYQLLLGSRVIAIGPLTPDKLETAIAPYVSYENTGWLRVRAADFIPLAPFLTALGLVDSDGLVPITVSLPGGENKVVRLPLERNPDFSIDFYKALGIAPPLRQTQPDKNYWYQFLADSQTGYIQYRVCGNDPRLPFQEFAQATLADLDRHNVRRIVVDLRENAGGNSEIIQPLIQGLKARSQWRGRLFALMGPRTFSSGMLNAMELKLHGHATLIGEPTGGKPGSYGEIEKLTLPNSKLVVAYTVKYFRAPRSMRADALYPDIPAALMIDDVLVGRDPVLTRAISAN